MSCRTRKTMATKPTTMLMNTEQTKKFVCLSWPRVLCRWSSSNSRFRWRDFVLINWGPFQWRLSQAVEILDAIRILFEHVIFAFSVMYLDWSTQNNSCLNAKDFVSSELVSSDFVSSELLWLQTGWWKSCVDVLQWVVSVLDALDIHSQWGSPPIVCIGYISCFGPLAAWNNSRTLSWNEICHK